MTHRTTDAPLLSALLVPAGRARAVRVVAVRDTAMAISDAIGGVLLDDPTTWRPPGGVWLTAYLGEDRGDAPDNPRLSIIATRLGLFSRGFHAAARGDALIVGTQASGADEDVPAAVLADVERSGVPVVRRTPAPPHVGTPAARCGGWTPAARARALRLSPEMVEADLADLGVTVPQTRLRRVLLGVEPAEPALLAALVEVLQLRDRSLVDEQVLRATTGPWLSVGRRVPARVAQILADARGLSPRQVVATAVRRP